MDRIKYPICIFQTYKGALSHLSAENLQLFDFDSINLTFGHIYNLKAAVDKFDEKMTSRKYFNIQKNTKIFISPLEISQVNIKGLSKPDAIKIQISKNDTEVKNEDYLKFLKKMEPNFIVCFSEYPLNEVGKKSFKRNEEKTSRFLQETVEAFPEKDILVPLALNTPKQFIESFVQRIQDLTFSGFMLHGGYEDFKYLQGFIKDIRSNIPKYLKIGFHFKGSVKEILFGLVHEISFFTTIYPFEMANQGIALNFANQLSEANLQEIMEFRQNFEAQDLFDKCEKQINLNDKSFIEQFEPLLEDCQCYSCQNHTRAYIYHLLICKEMTANVLLTIHNLHVYQNFFKDLQLIKEKNLQNQYIKWFINKQM